MKNNTFYRWLVFFAVALLFACAPQEEQGRNDLNGTNPQQVTYKNPGQQLNENRQNWMDGLPFFGDMERMPYGETGQNNYSQGGNGYDDGMEQQQPMEPSAEAPASNGVKAQVIQLTNAERQKNGLPKLKEDPEVTDVAQKKSEDMVENNYFSHTSPTYGGPFQMLRKFGVDYTVAAENIAAGQPTAEEVVNSWMKSPGHRKNILNKSVTHIGIGYAEDDSRGIYWTQMFIKK
ncbi:CAP domain-containing protein [Thalassobacillus hwangdonensis]|uniref:CAP domain-containing protein n=1 Tax=Thalassobacillus hwangdonensis TaxID=546108 RepID=A0ABW3KVT9_9BACI